MCFSFQSAGCHLMLGGFDVLFATWGTTGGNNSLTSSKLLPSYTQQSSGLMLWNIKQDDDKDDNSGEVWWCNIYGAWSSIVPFAYVLTSFNMLFSEGELSLQGFYIRIYEWWISKSMKLPWFAIFDFFISWRILAALRKLKSGMLPRFAKRWRS